MPLESALGRQSGLVPFDTWSSQQQEKNKQRDVDEEQPELTGEETERFKILRYCATIYDDARKAREPFETFDTAWDLFIGNVWPTKWPTWRAKITINKIRAFITFMQAVMTDNKPRISVEPLVPGSEQAADLLRKLVDRDWDENNMQNELSRFVLYGLIWGTAFMKIAYDPYADGGRGKHTANTIVPYRVFTNRTATCIEDAEYIIHIEEQTMGWIRRNFPQKAEAVKRVRGLTSSSADRRERDRDYIREGDGSDVQRIISAQNVNGNITSPQYTTSLGKFLDDDGEVVEVAEYWLRDDSLEAYDRQVIENGKPKTKPVIGDDGEFVLETVGQKVQPSEIDGQPFMAPIMQPKQEPVMEKAWRAMYPNGRLVVIAGGKTLLRDIPNPFQTDGFPFAMWKDYDVGSIWGHGEPLALKDCQIAVNKIASQVYDILEKTGNPSYKLKKGGGVNAQSIRNAPGLIIPMDEMDSLAPLEKPPMPREFFELFKLVSDGMGDVSGVGEAVRGGMPASNTSFATVDQLQESGAAPIRLKVRNLETGITRIGKLRIQLIQQFDNGDRPIRIQAENGGETNVVSPASSTNVQFRSYTKADLQGQVEFGIVPISSLSSSPAGTWNKWMSLYDKHLIDRRWFHSKFRIEGYRTEVPRMEKQEAQDAAQQAAAKDKGKPGPAPSKPARAAHRRKPAPASNVPSQRDNAAIR